MKNPALLMREPGDRWLLFRDEQWSPPPVAVSILRLPSRFTAPINGVPSTSMVYGDWGVKESLATGETKKPSPTGETKKPSRFPKLPKPSRRMSAQDTKAIDTWMHTRLELQSQLLRLNADLELVRLNLNAHMERRPVVRLTKAVYVTPVVAGLKRGREGSTLGRIMNVGNENERRERAQAVIRMKERISIYDACVSLETAQPKLWKKSLRKLTRWWRLRRTGWWCGATTAR